MSFPPPTKKQASVLWYSLTALALAILLVLICLLLWVFGWVLHRLSGVLVPMAFALILAYILDPVVEFFQRKKIPRLWSICLVFVLGILVVSAGFGSVLPDIQREAKKFSKDLPNNIDYLHDKVLHYLEVMPPIVRNVLLPPEDSPAQNTNATTGTAVTNAVETEPMLSAAPSTNSMTTNSTASATGAGGLDRALNEPIGKSVMPGVTRAAVVIAKWVQDQLGKVTTWVEFLIGFILVPVYLFYFLLEKDEITKRWTDYLPLKESEAKEEIVFVLNAINDCMIVFFRGQVLVAMCVGVLLSIAYLVLGLNYAILLGLIAGVLEIVPYLGTIVGLVLALAVAGAQFKDWTHALLVLGIVVAMKLLEDFVIAPRIIGKRVGLHPLTIIVAVMVGTTLMGGFMGALLAIPLTAALRTLMFRYVWTKEIGVAELRESEAVAEHDR